MALALTVARPHAPASMRAAPSRLCCMFVRGMPQSETLHAFRVHGAESPDRQPWQQRIAVSAARARLLYIQITVARARESSGESHPCAGCSATVAWA